MLVIHRFTASKDTKGQRETSGTREVAPGSGGTFGLRTCLGLPGRF